MMPYKSIKEIVLNIETYSTNNLEIDKKNRD